jgi:hypothetical protein
VPPLDDEAEVLAFNEDGAEYATDVELATRDERAEVEEDDAGYATLELAGLPAFGNPQPFPPAMGSHDGSSPGTQSEIGGQFSARAVL